MSESAVLDRFDGSIGVLNIGGSDRRMVAPRSNLPKSCKAGDWLQVELDGGKPVRVESDPDKTQ